MTNRVIAAAILVTLSAAASDLGGSQSVPKPSQQELVTVCVAIGRTIYWAVTENNPSRASNLMGAYDRVRPLITDPAGIQDLQPTDKYLKELRSKNAALFPLEAPGGRFVLLPPQKPGGGFTWRTADDKDIGASIVLPDGDRIVLTSDALKQLQSIALQPSIRK